jgi:hypothetical protein
MKQALALSALAVLGAASVAPAMAGPYLTTKVGAKGEGSDFDKSYIETRVGYETKYGNLKPYIEVGPAWENKDGEDSAETMGQLEIGTKIRSGSKTTLLRLVTRSTTRQLGLVLV